MMAEKLKLDSDVHDLKLGKSFEPKSKVAFHSIRYDFKPESLDSTKSSTVTIGENNSVTVNVPHVQSSGTSHTIFKGNKRPVQKECVLLIDHDTGEFTLEKLSNAIQLKKTRSSSTRKITGCMSARGKLSISMPSNHQYHTGHHSNSYSSQLHNNSKENEIFETDKDTNRPGRQQSPGNDADTGTHSNEDMNVQTSPNDMNSSLLLPSLDYVCSEFENRITSSFMETSPVEDKAPQITKRVRSFRLFRLRETEPNASYLEDSSDSLPDLPVIEDKPKHKTLTIVKFAKKRKCEIDKFLSDHKLDTQRRPFVKGLGQMDQFGQKHPEIFAKMKARLQIPDGELYALNNYLCETYCEELRGDGPAFIMMQKLEDIVDFVVKMYNEQ